MKSNKQVQVDFIISCIEKGDSRQKILAKYFKKWQSSVRTFDRLLNIGKEQYHKSLSKIKAAKEKVDIENAVNERKLQIADVNERKQILTQIIRGGIPLKKALVVAGKIKYVTVRPDWDDRRAASAELSKMEGDYAPDKVANVTADGQDVQQQTLLTDNQFSKLIETINAAGTG